MRTLLDAEARGALLRRLRSLEEGRPARWGRMNVHQMVCHVGDPLRIALGDLEADDMSTFLTRNVLRRLVLWGVSLPKGKVATFPEIDQVEGRSTRPGVLADAVAAFEVPIERFLRHVESGGALAPNPILGPLTSKQWARLAHVHTDYHLRQFEA